MSDHHPSIGLLNALMIAVLIFSIACCAKEPAKTAVLEQQPEAAQSAQEAKIAPESQAKTETTQAGAMQREIKRDITACKQYTVKKVDSLWWIAKYKDVYNDPFLWPIIYDANKDRIKNVNLIYPGQKLSIPRNGYKLEEIKMIRKKAGAAKPYLPPQKAKLPID